LDPKQLWLVVGFLGQSLFFGRFFLQWIATERRKKSVIPRSFWLFSLGGGAVLLFYSIHQKDPVFIAGQAAGLLIYSRNLWFLRRSDDPAGSAPSEME
jgi:lipid-A-disaccharide synthase-like uncharacterized protein